MKKKNNYSVIEGTIQNHAGEKIFFYSYPYTTFLFLDEKVPVDSTVIDNTGHFSFKLQNRKPEVFSLQLGSSLLVNNLYLLPESELMMNFTRKENKPKIISVNAESRYNKFLIDFLDTFFEAPSVKNEYYIASNYMDVQTFAKYNEDRHQKQIKYYENYFKNDSVDAGFRNYALNTINYGIASDRLYYLWKKRMKIENIHGDSAYFSFETKPFIENINAINCPAYIRFLNLYIKDTYERMVEDGKLPVNKNEKLIPAVEKFKLANQLLEEPFRSIVIFNLLASDMTEVGSGNRILNINYDSLAVMKENFINKYDIHN